MLATSVAERAVVRQVAWREGGKPIGILPAAGIFGANASGKSNVLRAMDDMRAHVLHSFRSGDPSGGFPVVPFRLDPSAYEAPSSFEIELVLDGVRHEYGFRTNRERVLEEWAFHYPRGRATLMFRREEDRVELGAAAKTKGRAVQELLRANALFLSTAASANHPFICPSNLVPAQPASCRSREPLVSSGPDDVTARR